MTTQETKLWQALLRTRWQSEIDGSTYSGPWLSLHLIVRHYHDDPVQVFRDLVSIPMGESIGGYVRTL